MGARSAWSPFPNTLLVRGERDYLVDPGLIMQGGPVIGALNDLGVNPGEIKDVILTHLHFDHAEGLAAWPQRRTLCTGSRPRPPTRRSSPGCSRWPTSRCSRARRARSSPACAGCGPRATATA